MKISELLSYSIKKEYISFPVLVALGLTLLNSLLDLYIVRLIKTAVDTLKNSLEIQNFFLLLGFILVLKTVSLAGNVFAGYFLGLYRKRMALHNQIEAIRNFLHTRYTSLLKADRGDIARRIISDATAASKFGPDLLTVLLKNLVLLFGSLLIMFQLSPSFLTVTLLFLVIYSSFNLFSTSKVRSEFEEARKSASRATAMILHPIYNLLMIKAYSIETRILRRIEKALSDYTYKQLKATVSRGILSSIGNFISTLYMIISMVLAGVLLSSGHITFGTVASIFVLTQIVINSLEAVSSFVLNLNQTYPSFKRLYDLKKLEKDRTESGKIPANHKIEFKNVSFSIDGKSILKNLNLTIDDGEWVGIVGKSGEGKSTLVKLLTGIYTDYTGKITIGGIDIREIGQKTLREIVTYIPQEDYIIEGTIRENLTIIGDFSDHELWTSLKIAGLDSYVRSIGGLDVNILNAKLILSGGERQRLSIARAYLKGGKIYIFDEAMSQLDSIRENHLLYTFLNMVGNSTVILIAHRISTVARMDKIFVLDNGSIVEEGTHQDLMEKSQIYKKLCELQLVKK